MNICIDYLELLCVARLFLIGGVYFDSQFQRIVHHVLTAKAWQLITFVYPQSEKEENPPHPSLFEAGAPYVAQAGLKLKLDPAILAFLVFMTCAASSGIII